MSSKKGNISEISKNLLFLLYKINFFIPHLKYRKFIKKKKLTHTQILKGILFYKKQFFKHKSAYNYGMRK
jgi:hypothetical protein